LKERKNENGCYDESVVPGRYLIDIIKSGFGVKIYYKIRVTKVKLS